MADPITTLMDEHRAIEKVLTALENAASRDLPPAFYERALEFLAHYADACHHKKEEDRLFPAMERHGVPREGGPIGVMCHEHVEGRGHIARMREALAAGDREALRRESLEYTALLRQHIQKEDNVLFVIARDVLRADEMTRLERQFEEVEATEHCSTRYRAMADELLAEAGGGG